MGKGMGWVRSIVLERRRNQWEGNERRRVVPVVVLLVHTDGHDDVVYHRDDCRVWPGELPSLLWWQDGVSAYPLLHADDIDAYVWQLVLWRKGWMRV